jgi:hypothetical protein
MDTGIVLSFDIGIKNLAYVAMKRGTTTDTTGPPAITDWGILNVASAATTAANAMATTSGPLKCSQCPSHRLKAIYMHPTNTSIGYCATHAKSTGFYLPEARFRGPALQKCKMPELQAMAVEFNVLTLEGRILKRAELLAQLQAKLATTCLRPVVKPRKGPNCKDIDLITVGRNMTRLLDAITYMDEVTHVIIENQISPLAGRMKTIQGMLTQYFILRRPLATIEYVSASNKLRGLRASSAPAAAPQAEGDGPATTRPRSSYQQNKVDSVHYTNLLLQTHVPWQAWKHVFVGPKRDDLADCFLQCLWWWKEKQNVPIPSPSVVVVEPIENVSLA